MDSQTHLEIDLLNIIRSTIGVNDDIYVMINCNRFPNIIIEISNRCDQNKKINIEFNFVQQENKYVKSSRMSGKLINIKTLNTLVCYIEDLLRYDNENLKRLQRLQQ
jgi:hypothetical protein